MPITLIEYQPLSLSPERLPTEVARQLKQEYGQQVKVESSLLTGEWRLTNQGYVGYIPLRPDYQFRLEAKVPSINLYGMLEYAFELPSFRYLDGLQTSQSFDIIYDQLAVLLADKTLQRLRQGLYQSYLSQHEALSYLRGRIDVAQTMRQSNQTRMVCQFETQTADIPANQILTWTLHQICRTGLCSERTLPHINRTYRRLQQVTQLHPFSAEDCVGQSYHRLNEDYRGLHALCRFFLEPSGPAHQHGDYYMVPFLVDMARLYERFVANWLRQHLPTRFSLISQERVMTRYQSQYFDIDLVLYDNRTGQAVAVLDTKYKTPPRPASDDIGQISNYATMKQCDTAFLIYPIELQSPFDDWLQHLHVQSLAFALNGDLEQTGQRFLESMFIVLEH